MLHNYRSRQVHKTLNGVNPSSSFRDMRSAKSGPNLWQIWQVFGPWASPYGANGQITMTVHNYRPRQFHRTSNGENPSSGYRDMGSASLAAARPPEPWRQYPSSPKGWGVTIGHLFYAASSFVHHFITNNEFKLELQSWNAQFGSKLATFFLSHVTLKFDGWRWKTIGHVFYTASSFVHHFIAMSEFKLELQSENAHLGQNRRFFSLCDLEIWQMTLKNNRAHLLSNIKLCAIFHHHMWIQTGVTVWKHLSWVLTSVTLTADQELLYGHHFCNW